MEDGGYPSSDHLLLSRYKDGCEIHPSENVTLQADGTMRRLIIRSADTSDAGVYTCQAGTNSVEFSVNIRGGDSSDLMFYTRFKVLMLLLQTSRTSRDDRGTQG